MPQLFGLPAVTVPGPRVLPVVGAPMRFYQFLDDPLGVVFDLRTHGDVTAVVGGNAAFVCVFGEERNRQVLSDPARFRHDEDLLRGPKDRGIDAFRNGMVVINGDKHKRHRRIMQPAFQRSALDRYAVDVVETARQRLDTWEVGPGRLDTLCRDLALCVAVKCFYGLETAEGVPTLGRVSADFMELMTDPRTILAPFDLPGTAFRRSLELADQLRDGLMALIEEKRRVGGGHDALSLILGARDDDGQPLSDPELVADASALFIAGHETTAWTLAWSLFLLDQHPDVLGLVLDELDAELRGRPPTPDDLPRLRRLDAVVKESMRILSAVPMLFMRVCAEETRLGEHVLPKGSNVVVSPLATHHDPALYPEPRRFRPERWTGLEPGTYGYLPFGAGPRACIGGMFASRSIRTLLAMILQRHRVRFADGRIDRLVRGNVYMAKGGLPVTIGPATRDLGRAPEITGNIRDHVAAAG